MSTGMKSLSQVMPGSGTPVALQAITVCRSFSTAFNVGGSMTRGYPMGTVQNTAQANTVLLSSSD